METKLDKTTLPAAVLGFVDGWQGRDAEKV